VREKWSRLEVVFFGQLEEAGQAQIRITVGLSRKDLCEGGPGPTPLESARIIDEIGNTVQGCPGVPETVGGGAGGGPIGALDEIR
jgi:hypothetical protein